MILSAVTACLSYSLSTQALTVLTGPTFTPAANAPLAGVLRLTTDVDARVSVSVADGIDTWQHDFYAYGTNQALTLVGFKPDRTNRITVTVQDKQRHQVTVPEPVVFVTAPLPDDFPILTLLTNQPAKMEPGYTLFRVAMNGDTSAYQVIVDQSGQVVWYSDIPSLLDVRRLDNGDLFLFTTTKFFEVNLLGETVKSWAAPANLPIDDHEGLPTDHGTILYLSSATNSVANFPTSLTNPNAPTATAVVQYQRVVELSATNSALLHVWSPIDVLEPNRITYLSYYGPYGWDDEHSNSIVEDPQDDSLIVSMRHQNAVIKFSRATGQLIWILGPPANWGPAWQKYLLTPVGSPFEWQYGQHSAVLTPQGTIMLFDDGNYRASPFDPPISDVHNYSRAVEYAINETNMTVSQVWEYGRTNSERFYVDKVGNAQPLPVTGNVLITFGSIDYINGTPPSSFGPGTTVARIEEVTHDANPQVVFDLSVSSYNNPNTSGQDCFVYRSYRIPDLYAHPAEPVADLTLREVDGNPNLEFSADPTHTYFVEASTDLSHWTEIGVATAEAEAGDFHYIDLAADPSVVRYYRVVTQ